jgi:HK97 gp10 family phage protein
MAVDELVKISTQLEGAAELETKLKGLDQKVAKRKVRHALKAGATLVLHAARSEAPRDTGALVASHVIETMKGAGRRGIVGLTVGQGFFKGRTGYGGAVHFGTRSHYQGALASRATLARWRKRGGMGKGGIKANPWLRRAADQTRTAVVETIIGDLKAGIAEATA